METELDINTLITNLNAVDDNNIPSWALILMQCMKGLLNILNKHNELSQKVEKLDSTIAVCQNNTSLLQEENKRLNKTVSLLEAKVDDNEQRSRNECLLIHGVEESENENTDNIALDVFNSYLGLDTKLEHIQRSHRLGPKRTGRNTRTTKTSPRPIIIRFMGYRERSSVFRVKKKLKGKSISISENLTQTRYQLLNAAKDKLGRLNVWSSDGRIISKVDGQFTTISSMEVLNNL